MKSCLQNTEWEPADTSKESWVPKIAQPPALQPFLQHPKASLSATGQPSALSKVIYSKTRFPL